MFGKKIVEAILSTPVKEIDERHGGPYDRGGADSWYRRGCNPHYYVEDTGSSDRVEKAAMTEDQTIKSTVDNIAQCTCKDQCNGKYKSKIGFFLTQVIQVITYSTNGYNAEYAQDQLAKLTTNAHAEGHTFIFGEVQQEPVANHLVFLTYHHMGLDPKLKNLVEDQDNKDDNQCFFHYV